MSSVGDLFDKMVCKRYHISCQSWYHLSRYMPAYPDKPVFVSVYRLGFGMHN